MIDFIPWQECSREDLLSWTLIDGEEEFEPLEVLGASPPPALQGLELALSSRDGTESPPRSVTGTIVSQDSEDREKERRLYRPRMGHKKTRHGCFNCKRRKIKVFFFLNLILGGGR